MVCKLHHLLVIHSDAPKEIDIEKIKNYIDSMNDEKEEKRKRLKLDVEEEKEVPSRVECLIILLGIILILISLKKYKKKV